jgi:glycosyltransferase involved in cell wall biosynthesis
MLPQQESGNIYTILLYRALESIGLHYVEMPMSVRQLLHDGPQARFHYLHFHWPEVFFHLRPSQPQRLFGLKGYLHLKAFWLAARARGFHIVWTVHEVEVHDLQQMTGWHTFSRRLLWEFSDLVFAHTPDVLDDASRRWGRKPYASVIPIGSYEGAYPDTLGRDEARRRLGIPTDAFAFVFFGNVRPYKGIDLLVQGFRDLVGDHPDTHLIIAGKPYSEAFADEVRASVADLPNVHLSLGYVPDDDIQMYLRAADSFVAPYKYIETCSAIYLALSFGLPIIIKSEGNVVEFAERPIGLFLQDAAQTATAMRHMRELSPETRQHMQKATLETSAFYSWESLKYRYRDAFDRFENAHPGG